MRLCGGLSAGRPATIGTVNESGNSASQMLAARLAIPSDVRHAYAVIHLLREIADLEGEAPSN